MAKAQLLLFLLVSFLLCQVKVNDAFTMGTHNNAAFPVSIETHRTMTKCALDRSAHAYLRAKNPEIGDPGTCGTDGIWNDLVRATNLISIGISEYKKVRDLIWQSCVDVDAKYDALSRYHFDGESLEVANDMVISNTRNSRDLLSVGQLVESRKIVGEMLHAIQDFYSHTNWVEMGNTEPLDTLGVARDLGTLAGRDEATCRPCLFDSVGYCYDNIDYNIVDDGKLMSGYYTGQDSVKPPGVLKCSHGGYLDSGSADGGINKDAVNEPGKLQLSPHGYLHNEAAHLAVDSSVQYLSNFWDSVGYDNYGKFLAFDRRSSTIVITIDTTGSMEAEINACLEAARQLALTFSSSASQPAYVLSPFNDPSFGPATYFENVTNFVTEVSKLTAKDGGDFPEMCLSGILLGATAVRQPGGIMFVFTDAEAKDAALEVEVLSLLKEKQLIVNFVITGSIDLGLYKRIASATGGLVLMVLDEKQIVETTLSLFNVTFVNLVADTSAELVEMMSARSEVATRGTPVYNVSTDSTVKQMSVVVATDSAVTPTVTITAEREVSVGKSSDKMKVDLPVDYKVKYQDSTKCIVEVAKPPAAELKISSAFSAASKFSLTVTAAASFNLALRFMRETPVGFSPVLSGEPVIGQPLWAYVEVDNIDYVVKQIELVNDASAALQVLNAERLASDALSFAAPFDVPLQSFRVRVKGQNTVTGDEFERLMPSQFTGTAAYLQLQEKESSFILYPSSVKQINFTLTNLGSQRTYSLSVAGSSKLLTHTISPSTASLNLNQTVTVTVTVRVPATNVIGEVDTISVAVRATKGGTDTNSFIFSAVVVDPFRDITAPQLSVVHTNLEVCNLTSVLRCNSTRWTATVVAQDDGGLRQFYVRDQKSSNLTLLDVSVVYSPPFVSGIVSPVMMSVSAPCCVGYLNYVAVDLASNLKQLYLRTAAAPEPTTVPPTPDPYLDFVVLEVESALTVREVESQLQLQFSPLFLQYCNSTVADASCNNYVLVSLNNTSSSFNSIADNCSHAVSVFDSTTDYTLKALYTKVYYVCKNSTAMPSQLLASFFSTSGNSFDRLRITSAYPASFNTTSPGNAPEEVSDDGLLIATIILSVVCFLLIVAVVVFVVYAKKMEKKSKKHASDKHVNENAYASSTSV